MPESTAVTFANYAAARAYLEPFAHLSGLAASPQAALERAKALVALLGNPQDAVPALHLAGTSGKGSTATILANVLHAHGLRVGLGLSPHVRHLLERVQVDGAPVTEADFCRVLGEMVPAINQLQASEFGAPTFFEILIALSYKLFAELPVDVVVMETGLGGRFDATNTISNPDKIVLFTDIGYDHVDLLGSSLSKIAYQKAGIIQPHNRVLTYMQPDDAQAVIAHEAALQAAQLAVFDPATALNNITLYPEHLTFDLALPARTPLNGLHLSLAGAHQAHNAGLAIVAADLFLRGRGEKLDERAVYHALARISLPGRMDQREWRGTYFIIDGAHNAQKMHALCDALTALYSQQRFVFVIAFKQGKDHAAILTQLLPLAAHLILTRFENHDQGMPLAAADPHELAALLSTIESDTYIDFRMNEVTIQVVPDVAQALAAAVEVAHERRMDHAPLPIVATGSLYLLAEVYAVLDGTA